VTRLCPQAEDTAVTARERDDYRDDPDGAPALEYGEQASQLVRRIVADPDDEAAWLAYATDLADHGHDVEAVIVRGLWPALRDSLLTLRSFDAVMADVRRNRNMLHELAAREVNDADELRDRDGTDTTSEWTKRGMIFFGLIVALSVVGVALIVWLIVLGPK
jgi:uncharacterized protein (TIGR02996 family)